MNVVYVLAPDKAPLMPCTSVVARLLLKQGKAKVVRRTPFTIKLVSLSETVYTQPVTLGVDTGSAVVGSAAADMQGNILYLSEIELRNDINVILSKRALLRRNRRNRKTRYRPARRLNRKNSTQTGRFSPTMKSKLNAHLREIRFVRSLLLTLCKTCHDALHAGTIILKQTGKKKGTLRHATQMNSIRLQLLRSVLAEKTWGFVTKEHRLLAGLPKEHIFDAAIIATRGASPIFQTGCVLLKKCISDGDFQQTKGKRSEQRITTGKIKGFRKFDKVRFRGAEYFVKGRMSAGYAILMDISGKKVDIKPIPKFDQMKRVSARSSWIMCQKTMLS